MGLNGELCCEERQRGILTSTDYVMGWADGCSLVSRHIKPDHSPAAPTIQNSTSATITANNNMGPERSWLSVEWEKVCSTDFDNTRGRLTLFSRPLAQTSLCGPRLPRPGRRPVNRRQKPSSLWRARVAESGGIPQRQEVRLARSFSSDCAKRTVRRWQYL
jgi:hypothetical protein